MNTKLEIAELVKGLDVKIYPLGTKIYRVLDSGDIIMDKVLAYRINIQDNHIELSHIGSNNRPIPTPEDTRYSSYGYGSRIKSWHFDRREANASAEPLVKIKNQERIQKNLERIAEIEEENAELAK